VPDTQTFLKTVAYEVSEAMRLGVWRGMNISWTALIAGYAVHQAFMTGDYTALLVNLGYGILGNRLYAWAAEDHTPSEEEAVALVQEALAAGDLPHGVLAALDRHYNLLQGIVENLTAAQLQQLQTADELQRLVTVFGSDARLRLARIEQKVDVLLARSGEQTALPAILWVKVPALPPEPLVGREELLADLVARLCAGRSPALSTAGMGGVGKTALAVALAHDAQVRAHFTGGVLWGGLGQAPDPASILNQWAQAVRCDLADLPNLPARAARLSAALAAYLDGRRLLVVLDDAWEVKAAQQLRLSAPGIVTLLTTRSIAVGETFAGPGQHVAVPELAEDPAYALLARLAPEANKLAPDQVKALANAVGGLPLALELLGSYLRGDRGARTAKQRQAALAAAADPRQRLQLATARLGGSPDTEFSLAQVIDLSLQALPASARAAFYALGAFAPKPARFDLAAALAVTEADEETISLLADANLCELDGADGMALHQVLADAAQMEDQAAAAQRHGQHYLELVDSNRGDWQRIEAVYGQVRQALAQLPKEDERVLNWVWALSMYWTVRGLMQEYLYWAGRALAVAERQQDIERQGTLLNNIGLVYSDLGEQQQALEYYEQALPLRQVGDKGGEAATLTNIGSVYSNLGDKQRALKYYEQALSLRRQVGDKGGEAATLSNIGVVYSDLGGKQRALKYYEQALPLRQQVGDKRGEAVTLSNIGGVYSDLGEQQRALEYFAQALPLQQQVGDKRGEAVTLSNIGGVYADLGEQQRALEYFEQALPLSRQVGDKGGEAATLTNIGAVYSALGDKHQALKYYEQALPLQQQVGDKGGEATTLNNIGAVYSALGEQQRALEYYERALPLRQQVGDKRGEATTLNNIGLVYSDLGEPQRALEYYEQALPLRRQVGDKGGEATTLSNIGTVYSALGEKQQALEYYEQALPLRWQVGDKRGEATTQYNIGLVYYALGEQQRALAYFEHALPLFRQVGDKGGEAATINNIGAVYSALGEQQRVLEYFAQALSLFQQVGNKDGEATVLAAIRRINPPPDES
jgi:tetratricopeptide (TPR) repeat protein